VKTNLLTEYAGPEGYKIYYYVFWSPSINMSTPDAKSGAGDDGQNAVTTEPLGEPPVASSEGGENHPATAAEPRKDPASENNESPPKKVGDKLKADGDKNDEGEETPKEDPKGGTGKENRENKEETVKPNSPELNVKQDGAEKETPKKSEGNAQEESTPKDTKQKPATIPKSEETDQSDGPSFKPPGREKYELIKLSSRAVPQIPSAKRTSLDAIQSLAEEEPPFYWNAGVAKSVTSYGASCTLSCFRPAVEPGDFSLLSVYVANDDPSHAQQFIQAGWIRAGGNLPGAAAVDEPDICRLFVYFTTVGSGGETGDNLRGYNNYQKGWEPVQGTFQPGSGFIPASLVDGAQRSVDLRWQLTGDRWNLRMNGTIIGYYPTSLFKTDNRDQARPLLPDVSKTLADHGTSVGFGGQVYGSSSGAMTTTDMGSGKFPEEGYKRSAFIGMMKYQEKPTQTSSALKDVDDSWTRRVDDPERYDCLVAYKSKSAWLSYMYIGGPGCQATGWSDWESVGGDFLPDAAFTTLSRRAGVIDVFVVTGDGRVMTSWWEDGNWSAFNGFGDWRVLDWGQGVKFSANAKIVAVSRTVDNLDIFAYGTDNKVYTAWWSEGHDWTGWRQIGGDQSLGPSPILSAISRRPGRLDVFFATLGNIYWTYWTDGVTADWAKWQGLGQPMPLLYNVLVLSRTPETMTAITTHGSSFVCKSWKEGGDWSPTWEEVGAGPGDDLTPFVATRIAGVARGGVIDLFAIGTVGPDPFVYTTRQNQDGKWLNADIDDVWPPIGPSVNVFGNDCDIVAVSRKASCVDLFVAGLDGKIYVNSRDESAEFGWWTGWKSLGGKGFKGDGPFWLTACSRNSQTLAVVGHGLNRKLWVTEWVDPVCGPRPFWCMSHNPNEVDATEDTVAISLQMGANCLAPDINKSATSDRLIVVHGSGTGGPGSDSDPSLEDYLANLHTVAQNNPQLGLIAFDCKVATHTPEVGLRIITLIRQILTHDLPRLNVIISAPKMAGGRELFRNMPIFRPREAIAIDEEDNAEQVMSFFAQRGRGPTTHSAYGNGVSPPAPQGDFIWPNLRRSIEQGVLLRAGRSAFRSVYAWTWNEPAQQKEYIRIGVDGLMADFDRPDADPRALQRLVRLVQTDPEMRRHVRMATRADSVNYGPPAAYALTVVTGTEGAQGTDAMVTFTVRGELGVAKKTVDTALRGGPRFGGDPGDGGGLIDLGNGRMESGMTDYVVIYSPDLGQLVDVTVRNDMSRSVLGNSAWRCESVRVQSALYGVDKLATFGVDIKALSVTKPLI
jgi:hypothetical protein